jgi:membrane-associated phospholipid phosphatase
MHLLDPRLPSSLDGYLDTLLRGSRTDGWFTWLMVGFTIIGAGWSALLLVPVYAIKGARPFTRYLAGTWCVSAILVYGLKALVRRPRPCTVGPPPLWGNAPTDYSFPSGHAAGAFTLAAFVAVTLLIDPKHRRRPLRWLVTLLLFVGAGWIALSRVYIGVHYPTDVVGGAAIGSLAGVVGGRMFRRRHP